MSNRIANDMRAGLISKTLDLDMEQIDRESVGDLMSRTVGDVDQIVGAVQSTINEAWDTWLLMISYFTVLLFYNPYITLLCSIPIPFAIYTAQAVRHPLYKNSIESRKAASLINSHLQKTLNGIITLRLFGREEVENERLKEFSKNQMTWNIKTNLLQTGMMPVYSTLASLGVVGVIGLGGRLFNPIEALSQQFQTIQQAMAGLNRIGEFLSEEQEEKGVVQFLNNEKVLKMDGIRVDVKNVRFGYSKDKAILKDVSLTVESGQKVAIIGRTGAGKTSLINLIAGLYGSWGGDISISGVDPFRLSPEDRRKLIGVVPQNINLFEGTIKDNITLRDDKISLEAVEKAARLVGLDDFIQSLPEKYDTVLGVTGTKLSFGQNQLISLTRAVVTDPPLLLLDEPTSGLDAMTEEMIFKAFGAIGTKRTIITISHRLSGIIDADEVYIMASGKIVQSGPPDKLAEYSLCQGRMSNF